MKSLTVRLTLLAFSLLTLPGCGSGAGALCDRALECEIIGTDDVDECRSDLDQALDKGDIEQEDISECHRCAEDNECGGDLILDCSEECAVVGGIVAGANIH